MSLWRATCSHSSQLIPFNPHRLLSRCLFGHRSFSIFHIPHNGWLSIAQGRKSSDIHIDLTKPVNYYRIRRGPNSWLNVVSHCGRWGWGRALVKSVWAPSNILLLIVPVRCFCCGTGCFVFWSRIFVLFEPYVRFHILVQFG